MLFLFVCLFFVQRAQDKLFIMCALLLLCPRVECTFGCSYVPDGRVVKAMASQDIKRSVQNPGQAELGMRSTSV